jgi:hypothetical protein
LRTSPSLQSSKLQHNLVLGEQNFIRASFGEMKQTKLGGAPLLARLEMKTGLVRGAASSMLDSRLKSHQVFILCSYLAAGSIDLLWLRRRE